MRKAVEDGIESKRKKLPRLSKKLLTTPAPPETASPENSDDPDYDNEKELEMAKGSKDDSDNGKADPAKKTSGRI